MKRCPQCGREYDPTMTFCLDDGVELLYGPASIEEPRTAILPDGANTAESPTRTLDPGEAAETRLHPGDKSVPPPASISRKTTTIIAALVGSLIVAALGAGIYWMFGGDSSKQIGSIAVMPFVNESGNSDVEYLADGMTETLIGSLSNIPNLAVKARSTVFFYKGKPASPAKLGKDLGVEAVLFGRVGERGEDLKLSLELVDTSSQDVIWFQQYSRKKSDLVSLQSEIAKDVSGKLKSRLSGVEEAKVAKSVTEDTEAYRLYLQGRYFWNKRTDEDTRKAIDLFKAAADEDPNFALAYAGLADCYVLGIGTDLSTKDRLSTGKAYAEKALALDDQLAEPHAALGAILEQMWKWSEVESQYKRAIELNPNYATAYHWFAIYLNDVGRSSEAASMIERAQELDPLSAAINVTAAEIHAAKKNFEKGLRNARRSIELDPNSQTPYGATGKVLLQQGRTAEAIVNLKKSVELSKRRGRELGNLGFAYAFQGNRADALAIAKELEENNSDSGTTGNEIAAIYAGLGDKDKAFEWLEKSFENKGTRLVEIRWHFHFASLRDDPRLADLVRRMGLPEIGTED